MMAVSWGGCPDEIREGGSWSMPGFELEEMDVAGGVVPENQGKVRAVSWSRPPLLLAMGGGSLSSRTVVSTAMPSIIAQLKGMDIYPWVFSAYLLASTVTDGRSMGKLADLWGRKRILLFGLGLFAAGGSVPLGRGEGRCPS